MKTYRLTFSLPYIKNSPVITVDVEAVDDDQALDLGFDEAFWQYPQYGGFQCDKMQEVGQ